MAYADELEWYIELAIAIGCLLFAVLATFIVCYCFCTGPRRESAVVVDGSATGSYHLLMGGVGGGGGNDHDGTTRDVGGATTSALGLSSSHPLGDDCFPTATGVGAHVARISAGTGDGSFVQRPPTREGGIDDVNNNSNTNYNINSDSTRSGRKSFINRSSSFVSSRPPLSSSESTGSLASASRRASAVSFIQPQQRSGHSQHQNSSNLSSSSSDLVGGMVGDSHGERREGDVRANNRPQSTSVNAAASAATTDNGGLPFRHQLESRGQHFGSVDGFDEL